MGPLNAHFTVLEDQFDLNAATEAALLDSTKNLSKEILKVIPGNTEHVRELVDSVASLSELVYLSASHIDSEGSQKQKLLELSSLKERSLFLLNLLKDLKENLTVQAEVRGRLNQKMGEQQRQHILREQLRTIKEELGEADGASDLETKLRNKLIANPLPEEVEKIFNNLRNIIKYNKEREEKDKLFQTKVNELKSIFEKQNLDNLQALKFEISEDQKIELEDDEENTDPVRNSN
jgi:ATP-dependent Lon protease